MTKDLTTRPCRIIRPWSDEARWWFDALAEITATAADTGGQMTIVEVTGPPASKRRSRGLGIEPVKLFTTVAGK